MNSFNLTTDFSYYPSGSIDKKDILVQAAIAHLKHESHDTWPRLMQSWSTTHALRRHILSENKSQQEESTSKESEVQYMVHDYFKDWPIFAHPKGYLLVSVNLLNSGVMLLTLVSYFADKSRF